MRRGGTRQPGAGTAAGVCDGTPAPVRYVAISPCAKVESDSQAQVLPLGYVMVRRRK